MCVEFCPVSEGAVYQAYLVSGFGFFFVTQIYVVLFIFRPFLAGVLGPFVQFLQVLSIFFTCFRVFS